MAKNEDKKLKKMYAKEAAMVAETLMEKYASANLKKCPRCGGKKLGWRLDASRWCFNCGQRVDKDCDLIPSFDRRVYKKNEETENEEENND